MKTQFSVFFNLIFISIFVSLTTAAVLLFEYTSEYNTHIIMNGTIIILLTYFIYTLSVPLTVSILYNSEKVFKITLQITVLVIMGLLATGLFAKFKYSPQRIFLREFNLGGRTEKIIFKNKQCRISGVPKKAFLIYKGSNFLYYETKNSTIGINKDCLFDKMFE